jgi:N-acetylglutamate synthase-like GNAT family acetyltransferase
MLCTPYCIRPARRKDRGLLLATIVKTGLNPLGFTWQPFILAENEEGSFLGCAQLKTHRDGVLELASIYVIPSCRGQGIAGDLIQTLISPVSSKIWLTCRASLAPFYTQFGFRWVNPPDPMPDYFKRVRGLFKLISGSLGLGDQVAVMVRDPER